MKTTAAVRVFMIGLPVLLMIGLIPLVRNDFALAGIYLCIIAVSSLRYGRHDLLFLIVGFVVLFFSEYLFISTGVETFERRSLFGIMPIWLPLLWAYVFVAIKRGVVVIERYLP